MAKFTYQIKTGEFEYINGEIEGDETEAVEAFQRLKMAYGGGAGLPTKEWCRFLDCYVRTGKPPEDGLALWEVMDTQQRFVINEVKKVFKRAK